MREFSETDARRIRRGEPLMSAATIRSALWEIVPAAIERDGRPAKQLARDTGVTPRAIENVTRRLNLPRADTLMALRRVLPELDAECRRIETMRSDLDPDMDRAAMELYRTAQRLLAERAEKVKIREDANGGA